MLKEKLNSKRYAGKRISEKRKARIERRVKRKARRAKLKELTALEDKKNEARTDTDEALAIATGYAISNEVEEAIADLQLKDPTVINELKKRFSKRPKKALHPSVAGNELYKGAGKESAIWREDKDSSGKVKSAERRSRSGVSYGLYV